MLLTEIMRHLWRVRMDVTILPRDVERLPIVDSSCRHTRTPSLVIGRSAALCVLLPSGQYYDLATK